MARQTIITPSTVARRNVCDLAPDEQAEALLQWMTGAPEASYVLGRLLDLLAPLAAAGRLPARQLDTTAAAARDITIARLERAQAEGFTRDGWRRAQIAEWMLGRVEPGDFTPPAALPPAQDCAVLISPSIGTRGGNGDLCRAPEMRRDTAGRLWAGPAGSFEHQIDPEDGAYIGPRPVVEVSQLPALGAVALMTDQDCFIFSVTEWLAAAQTRRAA